MAPDLISNMLICRHHHIICGAEFGLENIGKRALIVWWKGGWERHASRQQIWTMYIVFNIPLIIHTGCPCKECMHGFNSTLLHYQLVIFFAYSNIVLLSFLTNKYALCSEYSISSWVPTNLDIFLLKIDHEIGWKKHVNWWISNQSHQLVLIV